MKSKYRNDFAHQLNLEKIEVNPEQESQIVKIDDLSVSPSEQDKVKGGVEHGKAGNLINPEVQGGSAGDLIKHKITAL